MTYQLQLASVPAPDADLDVFAFMNKLRQEAGEAPPSAVLKRFHDALAELFPDTPWSEGHYAGNAGRLTLVRRRQEVVPHVLYLAGELGLTVVDNQSGEVHRPPTYQVVLEGPAEGVEPGDAATRLAALMRKPGTEMLALLSGGRRTVVKKGVPRFQANQYAAALRERAGCRVTLAPEPGPVARAAPPPPARPAPPVRQAPPVPPGPGIALAPTASAPPASPSQSPYGMPASAREAAAARAMADDQPDVDGTGRDRQLYELAEGFRLMCIAIGFRFLFRRVFDMLAPVPLLFVWVLLAAMGTWGTYRLLKGLGYGTALKTVLLLCFVAPAALSLLQGASTTIPLAIELGVALASLAMVIILGVIATRRMKRAGLKVGFFGASKPDVRRLGGLQEDERLASTTAGWIVFALLALAFFASSAQDEGTARRPAVSAAELPCELVGLWEFKKRGVDYLIVLADDGSYSGDRMEGSWRYADGKIHWVEESITPHQKESNRVELRPDGGSFTVTERNGSVTEYTRREHIASQRCKAPSVE